MKNVITLFALVLVIGLTGCNKFLEIEPEGEIPSEQAITSAADLQLVLNSTYDVLRSGDFMGGQLWHLNELLGDNIDGTEFTGDWAAYYTRNTGIFIGATRSVWKEPYILIYRTNVLLESFGLAPDLTEAEQNRITGEAKFLRAVAHFELVRLFGQPYGSSANNDHLGIPLRVQASQEALLRATVGEVYTQIIADLQDAENLLPAENNGYATSWAAKAYLAKVYFQMNSFQNAYDYANDVISNGPFTFDDSLNTRFSQGQCRECVFSLISTGTADHSGGGVQSNYRSDFGRPAAILSEDIYNAATADPTDLRGQNWYTIANAGLENEEYYSTKFNGIDFFNLPLAHLTELKLIRAESAAEIPANIQQAVQDINDIRRRAGLVDIATSAPSTVIEAARTERQLELVLEGNRTQELKRQATNGNSTLTIRGAAWDCPGLVAQLPDTELQANPNMTPNPEGGCQ